MRLTSRRARLVYRAYALAKPLLFRLDPERAHALGLGALDRLAGPYQALLARIDDPVTVCGIRFANRVGLAAGLDKDGRHIDGLAALGFGFVEIGTVTPLPQPGNPRPRLFRLPAERALINRFGFNNDGLDAFIARVRQRRSDVILGLNIGKNAATPVENAIDDYRLGLHGVYDHADYITVNISSPNTKNLRSLQSGDALRDLLKALAHERQVLSNTKSRRVPIFVKIAPDLDNNALEAICGSLQEFGIDGVIATNTTLERRAVSNAVHGSETGGLSGAPLTKRALDIIALLRQYLPTDYPVIGVGGIMTPEDAIERLRAGADLIQLYSGLIYAGPALVNACASIARDDSARR